jgi:hypothetical protein
MAAGAGIVLAIATVISSTLGASSSAAPANPVDRQTLRETGNRLAADAPSPFARASASVVPAVAPTTTVPVPAAPQAASAPQPAPTQASRASDFSLIGYRWYPCRSVTVESTGPNISDVVAELVSITGLRLKVVTGPADITMTWGNVQSGGDLALTTSRANGGWLTHAAIVIDHRGQPYLATVVRHELAHALGLRHAALANEVMYRLAGPGSPTDYQAGDLAGLRAISPSNC